MNQMDPQSEGKRVEKSIKDDFISLFLSNQRRIFTFILMYVPNRSDAEDLMQETASWMWNNFDTYKPGTNFGAWGVQVARYKILKLHSRTQHSRLKFDSQLVELIDARAEKVLDDVPQKIHALRKCLSEINEQSQRLLYLRYEKGLTTQKLAELLHRPVQGLYKTMARIHKMLLRCVRQKLLAEGEL
ncbi:MAG: sigma-70 family RNA polymerase sigma factor [Phycisphaerae bacterium]|nr:sigma-70 family RNA polymerase sigma factor [Phycisphaerae bacterium]